MLAASPAFLPCHFQAFRAYGSVGGAHVGHGIPILSESSLFALPRARTPPARGQTSAPHRLNAVLKGCAWEPWPPVLSLQNP